MKGERGRKEKEREREREKMERDRQTDSEHKRQRNTSIFMSATGTGGRKINSRNMRKQQKNRDIREKYRFRDTDLKAEAHRRV